jgi:Ankyrin repeats (3 copies)
MTPNDDTRDEELLARYRRAGADSAAPSDAVREAILAESRRVAEQLAKQAPRHAIEVSRPAANDSRWKIMAVGTAGAALLAALLFAPRYWENAPPAQVSMAPAPAPAPASAATQAQAELPKSEEVKPYAAESSVVTARQTPSESNSSQQVVVTQANHRSVKSATASLNPPVPAPTAPPSVAQNYAPVSPSPSQIVGGFPAQAARVRSPNLSAQVAESAARAVTGGAVAAADSALQPATLQSAVAQGDVTQTALLLDQGAVIDARDEAGRTPLMLAVTEGRLEIVRLLLARGADPNAADNTGHTPLQQATKRNLQDVAALLEQAGAH